MFYQKYAPHEAAQADQFAEKYKDEVPKMWATLFHKYPTVPQSEYQRWFPEYKQTGASIPPMPRAEAPPPMPTGKAGDPAPCCVNGCYKCKRWTASEGSKQICHAVGAGTLSEQEFSEMLVQQNLSGYVNTRDPQFGLLPLRYAITVSKPHYVEVLLNQGAKADASDAEGPVVNKACESRAPESIEILRMLLKEGAAVNEENRKAIDRAVAYGAAKRYLIRRSDHFFGFKRDRIKELGLGRVKDLTLGVVGQPLAVTWLLEAIMGQLARERDPNSRKPLVLGFGGKPGHGKTQTAELLANLSLSGTGKNSILKVDCNAAKHVGDLFGHMSSYIGSDKDTPLNKFLLEHDSKPGVVILDEADKLDDSSWAALMGIFDRGEWDARVKGGSVRGSLGTKRVSCRKIFFILTANFLDEHIAAFERKNSDRLAAAAWSAEHGAQSPAELIIQDEFLEYIMPHFRSMFRPDLGDAMSRRVNGFIPFFSFSTLECYILAEMAFGLMASALRMTTVDYPIGNIKLSCTTGALLTLAQTHDVSGGASSIQLAMERAVRDRIPSLYAQDKFNKSLDASKPTHLFVSRVKTGERYKVIVTTARPVAEDPPVMPPLSTRETVSDQSKDRSDTGEQNDADVTLDLPKSRPPTPSPFLPPSGEFKRPTLDNDY